MDMRIPPLKLKILLESNPLKSRILVERLAVLQEGESCARDRRVAPSASEREVGGRPGESAMLTSSHMGI